MEQPVDLAEVWRGGFLESVHQGHAAIVSARDGLVHAWGDPKTVILPRSSCKMVQALPLMRSGAAKAHRLTPEHLALACASHQGAAIHVDRVKAWLDALGLDDDALRCGPQVPRDDADLRAQILAGEDACRWHNNCSGKHTGFLTLARHLGAGPEYINLDHPVQTAVRAAFEEATGEISPGHGIDGCSAPNFATTVEGLARAMASFAAAPSGSAEAQLVDAMMEHPDLVAGEGRACTNLMRAMAGQAAVKTGAEGVFVAILPGKGLGVALKISDGATRGAECAITSLLVGLGVLPPDHAATAQYRDGPVRNWDGLVVGQMRPALDLAPGTL